MKDSIEQTKNQLSNAKSFLKFGLTSGLAAMTLLPHNNPAVNFATGVGFGCGVQAIAASKKLYDTWKGPIKILPLGGIGLTLFQFGLMAKYYLQGNVLMPFVDMCTNGTITSLITLPQKEKVLGEKARKALDIAFLSTALMTAGNIAYNKQNDNPLLQPFTQNAGKILHEIIETYPKDDFSKTDPSKSISFPSVLLNQAA